MTLVGATKKENTGGRAETDYSAETVIHKEFPKTKTKAVALHKAQEVTPEPVIPMDDGDFKYF